MLNLLQTLEERLHDSWRYAKRRVNKLGYGLALAQALGVMSIAFPTVSCSQAREYSSGICAQLNCGENAYCALTEEDEPFCICKEGYVKNGDQCLKEEQPEPYNPPPPGNYADAGTGSGNQGNSGCIPQCLNDTTLMSCPPEGEEFFTQECPAGSYCSGDACRTVSGGNDPKCSSGQSACRVTGIFDVKEGIYDPGAEYAQGTGSWVNDVCGEDDGYLVRSYTNYWFAHNLGIIPPPDSNGYYRLDLKMTWHGECCDTDYSDCSYYRCFSPYTAPYTPCIKVLFGDDQRFDYCPSLGDTECIFQKMTDFSTAGISGNAVRVNIEGNPSECSRATTSCESGIIVTKTRIWSCDCE